MIFSTSDMPTTHTLQNIVWDAMNAHEGPNMASEKRELKDRFMLVGKKPFEMHIIKCFIICISIF